MLPTMQIVALESSHLSQSEATVVEAIGERASLREVASRLNLSLMATWARIQRLMQKGAVTIQSA